MEIKSRLPFRLNEGILLEDVNEVIYWDSKIADLSNYLNPEILKHPDSIHLSWNNHICFGGLTCDVNATQIFEEPNPRAYHIYLEELHWVTMHFAIVCNVPDDKLIKDFKRYLDHFINYFGEPTFSYPKYSRNLPSIFWELSNFLISFSVVGGAWISLCIQHEPNGYEELKAKAKEISDSEGEGSRVNYVAW